MFEKQRVRIYDVNIESEFFINTVEMVPEPEFRKEMTFKTISPVVLSRNTVFNGKESQEYISPADKEYAGYFIKNLLEKHHTLYQSRQASADSVEVNIRTKDSEPLTFEQTGEYKSKLITIKEGTKEESRVRGYFYTFRLSGDPDIIRIGYEAGFGKQCSLGFGCAESLRRHN